MGLFACKVGVDVRVPCPALPPLTPLAPPCADVGHRIEEQPASRVGRVAHRRPGLLDRRLGPDVLRRLPHGVGGDDRRPGAAALRVGLPARIARLPVLEPRAAREVALRRRLRLPLRRLQSQVVLVGERRHAAQAQRVCRGGLHERLRRQLADAGHDGSRPSGDGGAGRPPPAASARHPYIQTKHDVVYVASCRRRCWSPTSAEGTTSSRG